MVPPSDGTPQEKRVQQLVSAAADAAPAEAARLLVEATQLSPERADLVAALERMAEHPQLDAAARTECLRELVANARKRGHDPMSPSLLSLYRRLLEIDPNNVDALLILGRATLRSGDEAGALGMWTQALEGLPAEDPRRVAPCIALGRRALASGEAQVARDTLAPLLDQSEVPLEVHRLLAEAARMIDDGPTQLRALRGIIAQAGEGPLRRDAELQLARELGEQGQAREGMEHAVSATRASLPSSVEHIHAARVWLSLAIAVDDPQQELDARVALRRGLGPELSSEERSAEAMLLADRLDDAGTAQQRLQQDLAARPTDALLLSALRHVARQAGELSPYLDALEVAVEQASPQDRDRLLTELAVAASDVDDAPRAHRALNQLSAEARDTTALRELRKWAVRNVGSKDEELQAVDQRLRADPEDEEALQELSRLVGEGDPALHHLLALAREDDTDDAEGLVTAALGIADATTAARVEAFGVAIEVEAHEAAEEAWPELQERLEEDEDTDEDTIVALVALLEPAEDAGIMIVDEVETLLNQALARAPLSAPLHRALASCYGETRRLQEAHSARLDSIADRHKLSHRERADLFIGRSELLDRTNAAKLLSYRAEESLGTPESFTRLIEALEARESWPKVLQLLSSRVHLTSDPQEKVVTLKHLARVASEVLGDASLAVEHLEAGLKLEPDDPELLLPLLEHHFAQTDIARAVELAERALDRVEMNDEAHAALGLRAADAALAQGQGERAAALLDRVLGRTGDDETAKTRRAELSDHADDPERRIELLAAVATRQGGVTRLRALEERALLLLDPLERPADAMTDLATVVSEAPERDHSAQQLAELYHTHKRFEPLLQLYESELPRRHGNARAQVLRKIATLQRDELFDLPRAEQALRLALEQLDASDPQEGLAHELREELVANLERQGRSVDLKVYLDEELRAELSLAANAPAPAEPRRALLRTFARLLREQPDEQGRAAEIYEQLERWNALPDDGLAILAHWYHRMQRFQDLVRVLKQRSAALAEQADPRQAAVDLRIAELLDGPLSRPHEAAPYFLDAFLTDPETHAAAGARARVLLSAVDSVVNVRARLLKRLEGLDDGRRAPLLTLLADVLAPHDAHEKEAEQRYREAIGCDGQLAAAYEGLGRLLSRWGNKAEAAMVLAAAAQNEGLSPTRAAEAAALAARNLIDLERFSKAEAVLQGALEVNADSPRVLLELARLYEQTDQRDALSRTLEQLSKLPLPGMTLANVAYRQAMLLEPVYSVAPLSAQGAQARDHLLGAVAADPRTPAARRVLLSLATAREEWSIVAHTHYLAIESLPPGAQRAIAHLDLATTYLDHLDNPGKALRNIESALQHAATDVVVSNRTSELLRRMPEPAPVAARFEDIAANDTELGDDAHSDDTRARLWLLAADLRLQDEDLDAARADAEKVLELPGVSEDASAAATRILQRLDSQDPQSLAAGVEDLLGRLSDLPATPTIQRVQLLGQLHDLGVSLGDDALVERAKREQLELAATLDDSNEQAIAVGAMLRDLLVARGEYGAVVLLYERIASQAGGKDPERATAMLVEAAGYAWRGVQDPAHAASLLGRALSLSPDDDAALGLLGELIHPLNDPTEADAIQQALGPLARATESARLRLLLVSLATIRGDDDEAVTLLGSLTAENVPVAIRFDAMGQLDLLLAERGEHDKRYTLRIEYFALACERRHARAGELGLELARMQLAAGDRGAARRSCELAYEAAPEHHGVLRLLAQILGQEADHAALAACYQKLAQLAEDKGDRAGWLTRAAQLYLDHPELPGDGSPEDRARQLLLRACEEAPSSPEPRLVLLPLLFRESRWQEVLDRTVELTHLTTDDEEVLVLAALAEALFLGEQTLAHRIGARHPDDVIRRRLLPGLQLVLGELAERGPLPRLDVVLTAGYAMIGGRQAMLQALQGWASECPWEAGLSLGLARLFEARGSAETSRHYYQLAAVLAPSGPVPAVAARLPVERMADADLNRISVGPMEGHSVLCELLGALRDRLAGLGTSGAPASPSPSDSAPNWWPEHASLAEQLVAPWRAVFGIDLPLSWTEDPRVTAIAVRNDRPPRLLIGHGCVALPRPELTFRLAYATATVALGMGALETGSLQLGVLLDALGEAANPGHQPASAPAQMLADVLAARNIHNLGLNVDQRARLLDELDHWLTIEDGLIRLSSMLDRTRLLLATRLSGQLDGALMALARDHGAFHAGGADRSILRQEDAVWLLRALSLR